MILDMINLHNLKSWLCLQFHFYPDLWEYNSIIWKYAYFFFQHSRVVLAGAAASTCRAIIETPLELAKVGEMYC